MDIDKNSIDGGLTVTDYGDGERSQKFQQIATGKVAKKSPLKGLMENFIAEDLQEAKRYFFEELLIPGIKDGFFKFLEVLIYGDTKPNKSTSGGSTTYVSYNNYSNKSQSNRSDRSNRNRGVRDYRDITFEERDQALQVRDVLQEAIEKYGHASISDYYDLVGVTGEYTDEKYGWYDISNSKIRHCRDGWVLDLPKAITLD